MEQRVRLANIHHGVQILVNYGIDAASSMAGTCNLLFEAPTVAKRAKRCAQLAADAAVAWATAALHGLTVMCQAIIYAVALNGSRNGLVALLIATQFAEIKGITYRRVDDSKLFYMAQMARAPPAACSEPHAAPCCVYLCSDRYELDCRNDDGAH
jgi:Eukaryotic membrane protein family